MTTYQPEPPEFDQPDPEPANALGSTFNAAEPAQVRRRVKQQAQQAIDAAKFWQDVLASEMGRTELWKLLSEAGTFDQRAGISANGGYDPMLSSFHAGQKAFGHHLFGRLLGYDREAVLLMLTENDPTARPVEAKPRRRKTPT